MAQPTVNARLDKYTYVAGETMTLTVQYGGAIPEGFMGPLTITLDTGALGPVEAPPSPKVGLRPRRGSDPY